MTILVLIVRIPFHQTHLDNRLTVDLDHLRSPTPLSAALYTQKHQISVSYVRSCYDAPRNTIRSLLTSDE